MDQKVSVEGVNMQLDSERIQAQINADTVALDRIYADNSTRCYYVYRYS